MKKNLESENNIRLFGTPLFGKNILSWNFFLKNAFIVTNFSMMLWSIAYHSFLGCLLLIWANGIWINKNQRRAMMYTSPLLVIYALSWLLTSYVFSLKLLESELPTEIKIPNFVSLKEIGLIKYEDFRGVHLLLKSVLMISFWMTMRLMFQERELRKEKRVFEIVVTIHEAMKKFREKKLKVKTMMEKILSLLSKFCVYAWMWIIVGILLAMGTFGDVMTLFRIFNMAFFLVFVLTFQFSHKLWIKAMYIFWWTLIIYAMCALILIYLYQFEDLPSFLYINEIGLSKYKTQNSFVVLLPFTVVIFLTGIQINRFHQRFLQRIKKTTPLEVKIEEDSTDEKAEVSKAWSITKQRAPCLYIRIYFFRNLESAKKKLWQCLKKLSSLQRFIS